MSTALFPQISPALEQLKSTRVSLDRLQRELVAKEIVRLVDAGLSYTEVVHVLRDAGIEKPKYMPYGEFTVEVVYEREHGRYPFQSTHIVDEVA